jgi:hypothetical protein
VSGSQLPSLQNAPDRKVQQIQVRRKRRLEPLPRVANTLTLKAKEHFFGVGMPAHGGRAPAPFPGIEVAARSAGGGRCHPRCCHCRNLCLNVQFFSDFGGGDTHGGDGAWHAHRPPPPTHGRSQGKVRRAQASPRRKQATWMPPGARSLSELIFS